MKNLKFIIFSLTFLLSSCFELFDLEHKVLSRIDITNQCRIEAALVAPGATTNPVIQVRSVANNKSTDLAVYEFYDWAELVRLSEDSILVKLSDSLNLQHIDTQYIKFNCGNR